MNEPRLVNATTYHGRHNGPQNAFRYAVDFVLLPMRHRTPTKRRFFSMNRRNALSFYDRDHGFDGGSAAAWVEGILDTHGIQNACDGEIWLLTQPRCFGFVFNPVSFWFCTDSTGALRAVIAEVNNTFGDRHAYLCRHDDLRPIRGSDRIQASKVFHVSPFQDVAGRYEFRFLFETDRVGAWIDHRNGGGGLYATLNGHVRPMTDRALLGALARRPLGALRVLGLIYWQALKLKWKGARYRRRPAPPQEQVST